MNDEQLLRYSRHILLPEIDVAGQKTLCEASVLIVGLGGLGSPVALYLAASGIGSAPNARLFLADSDHVELSNLQRQILHSEASCGQTKVASAAQRIAALNPTVNITGIPTRLEGDALNAAVSSVQVVVDCSDNFATRYALNAACVAHRVPLVSGAAIRLEGQLAVFDFRQPEALCYQCLYPSPPKDDESCSRNGVLSPVVGIVGSAQALEVIKLIAGFGVPSSGRLGVYSGFTGEWRYLRGGKDDECGACGVLNSQ